MRLVKSDLYFLLDNTRGEAYSFLHGPFRNLLESHTSLRYLNGPKQSTCHKEQRSEEEVPLFQSSYCAPCATNSATAAPTTLTEPDVPEHVQGQPRHFCPALPLSWARGWQYEDSSSPPLEPIARGWTPVRHACG